MQVRLCRGHTRDERWGDSSRDCGMRALGKLWASVSKETASGEEGEKPEVSGDITLSLADSVFSAPLSLSPGGTG